MHPIEQYWVLALLLHAWVVLMFGTLQGGTAKPGEGVWGSLTVALVGLPGQGESSTNAQSDGALAPQAQAREGRAEAGLPDAAVAAPELPEAAEPAAAPTPPADLAESAAPNEPEPALQPPAPPPLMDPPPPAAATAAQPEPVAVAPVPEAVPLPPVPQAAEPSEAAAMLAASVVALAVPQRGEALLAAAPPRPVTELAQPGPRVPASMRAPAPAASAPAVVMAEAKPPAPAPAVVVTPAPTPVPAPTPAPAPVVMRQLAAEAVPATPRGPAFSAALAPVRPAPRPPEVQTLAAADRVGAARRPVVQGQPEAATAAAPAASGAAMGDVSAPVHATAPAVPASGARLILELPRGGAMASQGVRGVVPVVPPPPERKSKLGEALDKAAKTDCREAYQKNGLLAVVPLVVDAVRDKGCQW